MGMTRPQENKTKEAIAVYALNFSYPQQPQVLQNLTFTIAPGERVGVIGPNGAGKTTLFLCLCGILSPRSGAMVLCGEPVEPEKFRPQIGLVFQNPNDQLFSASVRQDVAFGPENMGLSSVEVQRRTEEALKLTGTTELADRVPHHLSGGQKRMVAIASVIAMTPQVVIYDEPSANLDGRSRQRLIQYLHKTSETSLIASHDLELILEVTERVLLLDQGQLIADGNPREILSHTQLMTNHGLEVPYSLR